MNSPGVIWLVLLLVFSPFLRAQNGDAKQGAAQPAPQVDLPRYVQQLMGMQVAFMNPPPQGISIVAKEIGRQGSSGQGLVVQYHVYIHGLPPDVILMEASLPVGAEQLTMVMQGISVGKDGVLMCAGALPTQCKGKKPDEPIEFTMTPAKGEPYRLIFSAGETRVGLMIVPDPVETKSQGCTLSAVRLNPNFQLAFLSGEGYPPDSDVRYRFVAQNTREAVVHSDAKGVIRTAMLAAANGKKNGQASFEVLGQGCVPKVAYEWGTS